MVPSILKGRQSNCLSIFTNPSAGAGYDRSVYLFNEIPAAEFDFEKLSCSSEIYF